jgi:hypothetical protein
LTPEASELRTMIDQEAIAYWNILQFPTLNIDPDGKVERHTSIMDGILTERGLAHERRALTLRRAS